MCRFCSWHMKFDGGYVANPIVNIVDQFLSIGHQLNFLLILSDKDSLESDIIWLTRLLSVMCFTSCRSSHPVFDFFSAD